MYPEISVVIPCYKEAEVIRDTISTVSAFLSAHFTRFEIIIVTDGSPDQTVAHVEHIKNERPDIPLTLISFKKNQGKGAAVKAGILASQYDPILFIDADLAIPIDQLEQFLSALESADIAIASRLASGSSFEEPAPWYRIVMARGFHLLQIVLLGNFEFPDTQCGFKLFRRPIALKLFPKITIRRFAFDAELLFLAIRYNMRVVSLPVSIKKDLRNTNVNPLRDPINMFFALLKIRVNQFLGFYSENIVVVPARLRQGYWELSLIILLILLGAFLRSYHFSDWLHFEIDQSYDTLLVSPAVEHGIAHLPLLGPTAGGGRSLRLGPAFYYLEYLSAKIFGNTPPGHAAFVLVFSILSLPLFYFFIRNYFSRPIAISLLALFSTSFYLTLYSRFSWSPNVLPFLVLLTFFSLLKSTSQENTKTSEAWFLVAIACLAITTQIHFNAFFILPTVTALFLIIKRPRFHWKTWVFALGIVLFCYAPVLLSDIQNHGQNFGYFLDKFQRSGPHKTDPIRRFIQILQYDAGNFFLITSGIDVINGKKLLDYGFPNSNHPLIIWRISAIILLTLELLLLVANLVRERNAKRKDFLILASLWYIVSFFYFFSLTRNGYNIYPRFFLITSPLAIIFTGLLFERLGLGMREVGRQGLTLLAILATGVVASNLGRADGYFHQLRLTQTEPLEVETEDIFPNTNRITLSQQYAIVDYIASHYAENGEPVYIKTIHEYEPVFWYHLEERGVVYYDKFDTKNIYQEANYFMIYPTFLLLEQGDSDVLPQHLRAFFTVSEVKNFGSLTVLSLAQKDEALTSIRQYDSEKELSIQQKQIANVSTWHTLLTKQTPASRYSLPYSSGASEEPDDTIEEETSDTP